MGTKFKVGDIITHVGATWEVQPVPKGNEGNGRIYIKVIKESNNWSIDNHLYNTSENYHDIILVKRKDRKSHFPAWF